MTLAQIRQYDASAWFDLRFQGTLVPTLDEVLAALPNTCLNIELKTDSTARAQALVRRVLGCIYRHGAAGRVLLSSFDHAALADVRALDPTIALGALFVGRPWPPSISPRPCAFPVCTLTSNTSILILSHKPKGKAMPCSLGLCAAKKIYHTACKQASPVSFLTT
ncbi:hypothetical protein GCM10025858_17290 [Alicyclobacillus sacchari]|nr:hypothetical protein GCM10025858_17290 [Alicyclobacillus sacchari]